MIDRETFDTLADEYPTASWAIWSDDFPDEDCIEEDPTNIRDFLAEQRERMDPNVVFVGLNPGGEILAELSNFHGIGQSMSDGGIYGKYDQRLESYIRLAALTGGYMTDLSPVEEPDAGNVTLTDSDYESFADQLCILDQEHYTIICFGNKVFDALADQTGADVTDGPLSLRTFTATITDRSVRVYRVWHYSNWGAYQHKIDELRTQLVYIAAESIRDARTILWDKEVLGDVTTVVDELADGATLEEAFTGWETEYEVTVGKNRPRLDAYKDGVGIEHEAREQMNMRSHLLFADAMFQQGDIEVLVVIIPAGNDASKRRTANELHDDIFTEHHPLDVPVLVIEYDRDC